mgnify:CR=1 FL=1
MSKEPSYRDFLYDTETAEQLGYYTAIGRVCVVWGMLEFQFDTNVWLMYEGLGGHALSPIGRPRTLDKKIELWRQCYDKIPELKPQQEAAIKFADRLKLASVDRNTMLHTNWGNLLAQAELSEVIGGGFRVEHTQYRHYNAKLNLEWLYKLTEEIGALQTALLAFTLATTRLPRK